MQRHWDSWLTFQSGFRLSLLGTADHTSGHPSCGEFFLATPTVRRRKSRIGILLTFVSDDGGQWFGKAEKA
jgi:hypothetical protein